MTNQEFIGFASIAVSIFGLFITIIAIILTQKHNRDKILIENRLLNQKLLVENEQRFTALETKVHFLMLHFGLNKRDGDVV